MSNTEFYGILIGFFILSLIPTTKRRRRKKKTTTNNKSRQKTASIRTSNEVHTDEYILSHHLDDLTWGDFERLLYLYFSDNGYTVEETGTTVRQGNIGDGGVDLVLTNKKNGERTALQAKHWNGSVGVKEVRELIAAKRNYGLSLTMFVTSSDFTKQAKEEAERNHMELWNGFILERRLEKWRKWKHEKKKRNIRPSIREIAVTKEDDSTCVCGSKMVKRRNKQGQYFLGCSRFPECKHTRSI